MGWIKKYYKWTWDSFDDGPLPLLYLFISSLSVIWLFMVYPSLVLYICFSIILFILAEISYFDFIHEKKKRTVGYLVRMKLLAIFSGIYLSGYCAILVWIVIWAVRLAVYLINLSWVDIIFPVLITISIVSAVVFYFMINILIGLRKK